MESWLTRGCGADPGSPSSLVFGACARIHDDAPVERARLVQIAERGPDNGVHVIWHAPSTERLPAACRVFIETDGVGTERAGFVEGGQEVGDLEPDEGKEPDEGEESSSSSEDSSSSSAVSRKAASMV